MLLKLIFSDWKNWIKENWSAFAYNVRGWANDPSSHGGPGMSEVTVIGLGNMGSALARALRENGCTVTVWNRSSEKAVPLVEKGAVLAPSAAAAIAVSPIILVCLTNYAAANRILDDVATNLAGKSLVQFTTCSPQDARASETWAHDHEAEYLDCAITGSPSSMAAGYGREEVSALFKVLQKPA